MAVAFSVRHHSQLTSSQLLFFQLLRNAVSRSVVYLVRRLALECRVWQVAVALLDVKSDQPPSAGHSVQRVQEQPLVLDHAPSRFNQ